MMVDKLQVIAFFGAVAGGLYLLSLSSRPGKGWMRVTEKICAGAVICQLCGILGQSLGIQTAQSPLAALSAGFLGLPGAALCTALTLWP